MSSWQQKLKSACFCSVLLFCHVVTGVATCTVHTHVCSNYVYLINIIIIIIIIIIILHTFPSNKWRADTAEIEGKKKGWKMW
jgi:surface polysaccharide O-acyltransferase-like enzyme